MMVPGLKSQGITEVITIQGGGYISASMWQFTQLLSTNIINVSRIHHGTINILTKIFSIRPIIVEIFQSGSK